MMRHEALQKYNKKTYRKMKDKYPNLQLGFFKNNHILFIGQNPGNPFNSKTTEQTKEVLSHQSYIDFENKYFEMIRKTKIGSFITELVGHNWNHISFTNIVKIPTSDNKEPSQDLVDEFKIILQKQITYIQPTLVILLGKFAGRQFGINRFLNFKEINGVKYVMIPHPSFINRLGHKTNYIENIKSKINDFLFFNGIVKVTKFHVFYRDLQFKKVKLEHHITHDYCFIRSINKTEYKSFDGYYLDKISKNDVTDEETYEKHIYSKDVFYYQYIDKIQHSKMIRYLLFDIENDFCNDIINTQKPVTSIAYYDNLHDNRICLVFNDNGQKVLINDKYEILEFSNEKEMIEYFFQILQDFDVMCGWYSNGFDIPYLINRAEKLNIDLNKYFLGFKRSDTDNNRFFQNTIIFYDALEFYKRNTYYNKPPSFALDVVAKFLFGDEYGKIEHEGVDVLWRNDINKLVEYNLRDVKLLKMIVDSNSIINYPLQLQQICPQDFENVYYNSKTIENLLHHRYWNKNIFFPTKKEHEKRLYKGGAVNDPVSGLHKNVAVFDFAAMYTNIYLSMNFSPDTLIGEKKYVEDNFEIIKNELFERYPEIISKCENLSKFDFLRECVKIQNDFGEFYFLPSNWKIGILPALEREMLSYRKMYTNIRDSNDPNSVEYQIYDELQGQAKTILNSIYGVAAFKKFILFNDIIPASITSIARKLNNWVQKIAGEDRLQTVYGDTDSIFIKFNDDMSIDELLENTKKLENRLNKSFNDFMLQFTKNEKMIKNNSYVVESEKVYSKLMLTEVKKRYFGYLKLYKGKILDKLKLSITGFETRRDDTPEYFKRILFKTYQIFLGKNKESKLREVYKQLHSEIQTIPIDELTIKLKLSRDIDSYLNVPIHVRALKNSNTTIRRGENVNMIYVKTHEEVLHYDSYSNQKYIIDYDKYIEKFFLNKIKLIDDSINLENKTIDEFI